MSDTIVALGGAELPVGDLATSLTYGSGFVTALTITYQGIVYIQSIGRYSGGLVNTISQWTPQSLSIVDNVLILRPIDYKQEWRELTHEAKRAFLVEEKLHFEIKERKTGEIKKYLAIKDIINQFILELAV